MVATKEIMNQIKSFSIKDRLLLVEHILRTIREEDTSEKDLPILAFAGIISDEEALEMNMAILDCRKIDTDRW